MKGILIKRADIEKRERNTDKDIHTPKRRLRAYDEREQRRATTLRALRRGYKVVPDTRRPPAYFKQGRPYYHKVKRRVKIDKSDWGLYILGGDKGSGKSLIMSALAEKDWCDEGRPVFSNLGFEFGYQIAAIDIYLAISGMPEDGVLIIDEAHQPLANVGSSSLKHLAVRQMLAGLRKKNQKVFMLSSQVDNIDGRILDECDWALTPMSTYPGKEKTRNRNGELAFAGQPWLWKKLVRIGPRPYVRRKGRASDIFSSYGINVHGAPPKRGTLLLPPSRLLQASLAYDSFAPLMNPMESGMGVTADQIRKGLTEDADWVDFGDENNPIAGAGADGVDQAVRQADVQYDHARMTVFLNALVSEIEQRQIQKGTMSLRWAALTVTETVDTWPTDYHLLAAVYDRHEKLSKKSQFAGDDHFPAEFTEGDAKRYMENFCGSTGDTFSVPRFLDAVNYSQQRAQGGHGHAH